MLYRLGTQREDDDIAVVELMSGSQGVLMCSPLLELDSLIYAIMNDDKEL